MTGGPEVAALAIQRYSDHMEKNSATRSRFGGNRQANKTTFGRAADERRPHERHSETWTPADKQSTGGEPGQRGSGAATLW